MSHYAVLVMSKNGGKDIEDLLAPYNENIEVEPYVRYTREEAIEHQRDSSLENLKYWATHQERDDAKEMAERCFKHIMKSDEELYQEMVDDYDGNVDADGNILSTYNPKSKWDWWSYGGRWDGLLRNKEGEAVDEGYASELDLSRNKEEYKESIEWWEKNVEKRNGEMWYSPQYYIDFYKDKETYATIRSLPIFRSVVTPDGEWHEKGKMGWWAMTSETPEESLEWDLNFMERYIKPAIENNWYLTLVDCHI